MKYLTRPNLPALLDTIDSDALDEAASVAIVVVDEKVEFELLDDADVA